MLGIWPRLRSALSELRDSGGRRRLAPRADGPLVIRFRNNVTRSLINAAEVGGNLEHLRVYGEVSRHALQLLLP